MPIHFDCPNGLGRQPICSRKILQSLYLLYKPVSFNAHIGFNVSACTHWPTLQFPSAPLAFFRLCLLSRPPHSRITWVPSSHIVSASAPRLGSISVSCLVSASELACYLDLTLVSSSAYLFRQYHSSQPIQFSLNLSLTLHFRHPQLQNIYSLTSDLNFKFTTSAFSFSSSSSFQFMFHRQSTNASTNS